LGFISIMNKTLFLCLCFSFFCCQKKENKLPQITSGAINTIAVIIDDQLWNGEVGDSIRNKFASPVLGLPQEEPLFSINQYPVKLFEGFSTDSRNIIIVKKEGKTNFKIQENEYATPQNAIHISGKSTFEIIAILEKNKAAIINKMRATELLENQRINKDSLLNPKKIKDKFNISLDVPSKYKYVMRRKNFIWLKKEITSGNMSILIYQLPISAIPKYNEVSSIIKYRDSIGRLFIHGTESRSKMITEAAYSPYFSMTNIDWKRTYETKGTWEMNNDFMSGPFINYAIIDKKNKRILVLEGFCYAPSKEKRDLMFELESIIKSIRF
jgi:hypothetical protein